MQKNFSRFWNQLVGGQGYWVNSVDLEFAMMIFAVILSTWYISVCILTQ